MKFIVAITLFVLLFVSTDCVFAEQIQDTFIGRITLPNSGVNDAKSRREIAKIAQKIKKMRKSGSVRIVGSVPSAASQDEFISRSVFIARDTENHLRKLLPKSFQFYVSSVKFEKIDLSRKSDISVYLYPFELKAEGARFVSTDIEQSTSVSAQQQIDFNSSSRSDSWSDKAQPQYYDNSQRQTASSDRTRIEPEDAEVAAELVKKAKAKAAKRAKQLENQ